MGGLLHLVQRGVAWAVTVLLYDGPLLCGFNAAIKGLICNYIATNVPRVQFTNNMPGLINTQGS